jgi:hypothetical protein
MADKRADAADLRLAFGHIGGDAEGSMRRPRRAIAARVAGGVKLLPSTRSGRRATTSSSVPSVEGKRRASPTSIELCTGSDDKDDKAVI